MAQQLMPGRSVGYVAKRVNTNNGQALGKLTDKNHLSNIQRSKGPTPYDKALVNLYTQTSQKSNDFTQMLKASDTFWTDDGSWKYKIGVAYQKPRILSVPSTNPASNIGRDGEVFSFVLDKNDFGINHIITAHLDWAQQFHIIADPQPYNGAFLYQAKLASRDSQNESVDPRWLEVGTEYEVCGIVATEFTEKGPGLPGFGGYIEMYDTMAAEAFMEHTVTSWADCTTFGKSDQELMDVIVYQECEYDAKGNPVKWTGRQAWEPFIERLMREHLYKSMNTAKIWGKGGTIYADGAKPDAGKTSYGIIPRIRNNGNYYGFNKGELSQNVIRDMFGDMFYNRESIQNRRVKLYANESGMQLFNQMNKEDLMQMGLTIIADNRFIEGSGRNMMVNYAFPKFYSMETGVVELIHLTELDLPKNKLDLTVGKKTPPKFLVFDVSPDGSGLPQKNIREVRMKGYPSMTWGYQDGRWHHLGHSHSQGMASANTFPGYKIWMADRSDIFIEDLTRTFLIEELPQYL